MRFKGGQEDMKVVEQELKRTSICSRRNKRDGYDKLFGITSIVETDVYDVLSINKLHVFSVRIFWDNRDGEATLDIADKNIVWLKELSPNMSKYIDNLIPERVEG